jgi:hypothetical protein
MVPFRERNGGMILDRNVVFQLHQSPGISTDRDLETYAAWVLAVESSLSPVARTRIWASTMLIKAGTALRAPVLPDMLINSSPGESDLYIQKGHS